MSKWRDFPDEPGWWWGVYVGYQGDGCHTVSAPKPYRIDEVTGDLAIRHTPGGHDEIMARRPPGDWREKQSAAATSGRYSSGREHFWPERWCRIADAPIKRDKHDMLSRDLVWGSR